MAWTKVKEHTAASTSGQTLEERTAKRVFVAVSDTPTTPVVAERASHGGVTIPRGNEPHPDDPRRTCRSIDARPDPESGRMVFTVEASYSDKYDPATARTGGPLDWPMEISWDFDDAAETYFLDRSDPPKPTVNSAGERFETLLERDTGSIVATVTKNIPADGYSPATAIQYKDAVNLAGFKIDGVTIDAGQCKMKSYTAGPRQKTTYTNEVGAEIEVEFRPARWILQFRRTWDHLIEDRGYNQLGIDGKHKEIMKGTPSVKPDTPWPLEAGGAKQFPTQAPAVLTFVPYNKLPFAPFNFT